MNEAQYYIKTITYARRKIMHNALDIVIPTFNRPAVIAATAAAIARQMRDDDRLLIVWQGTKPFCEETPQVRLIASFPPNLPRARNIGIRAGTNELVLLLDDDVEVDSALCEEHRRAFTDEKIGCVAGYIDDAVYDTTQDVPSFFDVQTGRLRQNFSCSLAQPSISAPGGNMSFRRSVFDAVGGFDENFAGNALWEEIDFSFRVRAAGYSIAYNPLAKLRHTRCESGGCRNINEYAYLYRQFANTAYFAARYAPPRYYRSWLRYWKYRLEYLSRKKGASRIRHDPFKVLSGIAGAGEGVLRYAVSGRRCAPKRAVGSSFTFSG